MTNPSREALSDAPAARPGVLEVPGAKSMERSGGDRNGTVGMDKDEKRASIIRNALLAGVGIAKIMDAGATDQDAAAGGGGVVLPRSTSEELLHNVPGSEDDTERGATNTLAAYVSANTLPVPVKIPTDAAKLSKSSTDVQGSADQLGSVSQDAAAGVGGVVLPRSTSEELLHNVPGSGDDAEVGATNTLAAYGSANTLPVPVRIPTDAAKLSKSSTDAQGSTDQLGSVSQDAAAGGGGVVLPRSTSEELLRNVPGSKDDTEVGVGATITPAAYGSANNIRSSVRIPTGAAKLPKLSTDAQGSADQPGSVSAGETSHDKKTEEMWKAKMLRSSPKGKTREMAEGTRSSKIPEERWREKVGVLSVKTPDECLRQKLATKDHGGRGVTLVQTPDDRLRQKQAKSKLPTCAQGAADQTGSDSAVETLCGKTAEEMWKAKMTQSSPNGEPKKMTEGTRSSKTPEERWREKVQQGPARRTAVPTRMADEGWADNMTHGSADQRIRSNMTPEDQWRDKVQQASAGRTATARQEDVMAGNKGGLAVGGDHFKTLLSHPTPTDQDAAAGDEGVVLPRSTSKELLHSVPGSEDNTEGGATITPAAYGSANNIRSSVRIPTGAAKLSKSSTDAQGSADQPGSVSQDAAAGGGGVVLPRSTSEELLHSEPGSEDDTEGEATITLAAYESANNIPSSVRSFTEASGRGQLSDDELRMLTLTLPVAAKVVPDMEEGESRMVDTTPTEETVYEAVKVKKFRFRKFLKKRISLPFGRKASVWKLLVLGTTVLIGVVVVVVLKTRPHPLSRAVAVKDLASHISGPEALADPKAPQSQALRWLLDVDEMRVDPRASEEDRARAVRRYVLAALYFSTGGEGWRDGLGFLSGAPECEWNKRYFPKWTTGVVCDPASGNVTEISLANFTLQGTLPARELSALPNLRELWLYDNELSGKFLVDLKVPSLQKVSVGNNLVTGTIPTEIAGLVNLIYLHLYDNALVGTIVTELGELESLERLYLDGNNLEGGIPSELGQLTFLNKLDLSRNYLTGNVPDEVCGIQSLYKFVADCRGIEVECACCTWCCDDALCCPAEDEEVGGSSETKECVKADHHV